MVNGLGEPIDGLGKLAATSSWKSRRRASIP
jgi:hypothetical protein